jgi:hypothetical protein
LGNELLTELSRATLPPFVELLLFGSQTANERGSTGETKAETLETERRIVHGKGIGTVVENGAIMNAKKVVEGVGTTGIETMTDTGIWTETEQGLEAEKMGETMTGSATENEKGVLTGTETGVGVAALCLAIEIVKPGLEALLEEL